MTAATYIINVGKWDEIERKVIRRDVRVRAELVVKHEDLLSRLVSKAARSKSGKATALGGTVVVYAKEI